jgi:hypothetical protein
MTSAQLLAHTMDETRNLTRFYISKLKGEDMHRQFEVNGYTTHSAYWILAHLCWAEHMILIESLGHPKLDIPWLKLFRIGSGKDEEIVGRPTLEEVFAAMKDIHAAAMKNLSRMTDDELAEDNTLGMAFDENRSKRYMAMHAIRHEGTHCGQLSLIAKMYGKHTV